MGKKLLRIFLWMAAVQAVAFVAGIVMSKKLTKGDETSDEFEIAAIFGGKRFHSTAGALKSGSVMAALGGIEIDLRDATVDPAGAEIGVTAALGGVQVFVPKDWIVEVDSEIHQGDVDLDLVSPDDLPADAPKLHIHAIARAGGVAVTAKA